MRNFVFTLTVVVCALLFSASVSAQSVVINKYQNSGTTADIVELLVIQNNLDMRGMILKDFSTNMANDGGGKYQFSNDTLWSSLPAGTIIVLRNNNSAADTTVGGGDFNLDVGLQNTTYFSNAGGTFDIATTEMVMIKAAGSGAAGVTGSIHALAGGTAGAQFTAAPNPKLRATGTSGTGQFVYANNSTQSLADFDGTDATGAATGLTFGAGNNANNTAYINSLRTISRPTTQASNITFSAVGKNSMTVNWTPGNGASRLVVARQGSPVTSSPTDGTFYKPNASFGVGSQVGPGEYVVYSGNGASTGVANLAPNTTYYFAIFEYNGAASTSLYLTTQPATGSQTTTAIYNISGHVDLSGGGNLQNVSVTLTGVPSPATVLTDSNGNYSFNGLLAGGNYTVTPTLNNYSFSPASQTINNLSANAVVNFVATLVGQQPCTYSVTPTSANYGMAGGSGNLVLTTQNGCAWTAQVGDPTWLKLGDVSGQGNANIAFSVSPNNTNSQRSTTVNIQGQIVTITQDAGPYTCTFTLDKTSANFSSDGGTGTVNVTTLNGCAWTAVSNDNWITISAGAAGDGNGAVNFSVAANGDTARAGTITIAGQTVTITQSGSGSGQCPSDGEHMVMGNPSCAQADVNLPLNYLLPKAQYVVGYNRDRGIPNWVSWHLDTSWLGSAPRQDDFRNDPSLPAGWYQVQSTDYSGSGFDRGHHCPSADRTSSIPDNSATFFMTNMMPQAPDNNQGPWEVLESYSRTLVGQGNELYIIAGGTGMGGTGSNGGVTVTVANGHVTVPAYTWKVIMVLPAASGDDVSRVTTSTRVIAIIMPNQQGIRNDDWHNYRVSVDQVEQLTGYDFFSNVPVAIQSVIEAQVDNQP
ncbi:MAG TPA: DNA/RNA non-specific endonuclease [Pyrinomonadaceae bacterium]|nr:DNA/RNA non-specific endonuclease [Pyrinomonadaceae bacterium]